MGGKIQEVGMHVYNLLCLYKITAGSDVNVKLDRLG
jgi:hypothetical protein